MLYLFLGGILGAVLGMSGSGGAIIGIPLVMWLTGQSLKASTALILPIVGIAALMTWVPQRQHTRWAIVIGVVFPMFLAATASGWIRAYIPDLAIKTSLVAFAIWGLISTWKPQLDVNPQSRKSTILKSIALGSLAGVVTTLTGLGGGLLLIPLLKQGFRVSISTAVSTSLMMISLSCAMAMISLEYHHQLLLFSLRNLGFVVGGIAFTSWIFKHWLAKTPIKTQHHVQKWVYSSVLVVSILGLLVK